MSEVRRGKSWDLDQEHFTEAEKSLVVTPVEERIDHEEAKRIAKAVIAAKFEGRELPVQQLSQEAVDLWVGYAKTLAAALLTEHSAREELRETLTRWCDDDAGSRSGFVAIADIRMALEQTTEKENPCQ